MAGLLAVIAIMMIFSLLTYQAWEDVVRRDNEAEMMFRAEDIVRAVQKYRRDHGGLGPQQLKDLMEPGPRAQYYLRRLYKDPLARDGKWGLLYVGPDGGIVDPNASEEGLTAGLGLAGGGLNASGSFGLKKSQPPPQQLPPKKSGITPLSDMDEESVVGGKQLTGLPIAGVRSLCTEKPFRVYKGLTEYTQWWFTYFDLEPVGQQKQNQPPTNPPPG